MSALTDSLGLAEVFELADTGELFVVQGTSPDDVRIINVAELPVAERSAIEARVAAEGVLVFDREDLESRGITVGD